MRFRSPQKLLEIRRVQSLSLRPQHSRMTMQEWFLEQLPTIDKAIVYACRRFKLSTTECEDFASSVKLKLIENDYAILRRFEQRSSFSTFIVITVRRMLINQWVQERGRWSASAEARRMGDAAVRLERMLHRDGRPLEEVVPIIAHSFDLENRSVEDMAKRLPQRRPRPREVDVERVDLEKRMPAEFVENAALRSERQATAERARDTVRKMLSDASTEDRVILRLRFFGGMTVADIARSLHLEQKLLYRRIEHHLRALRKALEENGIGAAEITSILEHMPDDFADELRNASLTSSITMEVANDQGASS